MENKINRMKELLAIMKKVVLAYYLNDDRIVSDREWDSQFDELAALEKETGIIYASSPTQKVGGGILPSLPKVIHSKPMLSAAKTKSTEDIDKFAGKGPGDAWSVGNWTDSPWSSATPTAIWSVSSPAATAILARM